MKRRGEKAEKLNILVLADVESKSLWDFFDKEKLSDVDLILSAGDLKPQYLEFLATFAKVPILYVHGNHDDCYDDTPPNGCICVDNRIYVYKGIRILGLGGSMRYKQGHYQYTQEEMRNRVMRLIPKIMYHRGFDILLTHSPAFEINDDRDRPHTGFRAFVFLMEKYCPKFFIHGHVHLSYGRQFKRVSKYKETTIINAYEKYEFEYED